MKYVIQEHFASHHHYDLRLEYESRALSWAIPKAPPKEAGIRRLAVQVDDHDVAYMRFEGRIPEGNYGAGDVKIWDKGTWEPESMKERKIVANIEGEQLHGSYTLVHFKGTYWLFFKNKG